MTSVRVHFLLHVRRAVVLVADGDLVRRRVRVAGDARQEDVGVGARAHLEDDRLTTVSDAQREVGVRVQAARAHEHGATCRSCV